MLSGGPGRTSHRPEQSGQRQRNTPSLAHRTMRRRVGPLITPRVAPHMRQASSADDSRVGIIVTRRSLPREQSPPELPPRVTGPPSRSSAKVLDRSASRVGGGRASDGHGTGLGETLTSAVGTPGHCRGSALRCPDTRGSRSGCRRRWGVVKNAVSPFPLRTEGRQSGTLDAVISDNVRALRIQRRWRQQDLAVAAGWPRAAVVAIEGGHRRLTIRDAAVLCTVLQVPLATLIDGADERPALGL